MNSADDSEVIYEFDLNLSSNRCDLFSFSTKDYPFNRNQENTYLDTIQVKPNAKQFEIKLKFNETDNLVRKKSNELRDTRKFVNKQMNYKMLKSNHLPDTKIQYGVCYLTKNKKVLDIVPVENVFDFQTDFTYLDNLDKVDKPNDRPNDRSSDRSNDRLSEKSPNKQTDEEIDNSTNQLSDKSSDILIHNSEQVKTNELQSFTLRYESNFEYSPWSHVSFVNMQERTIKEPWNELKLIDKDVKTLGKKRIKFSDDLLDDSKSTALANHLINSTKYCLLPKLNREQISDLNSISLTKIKTLQFSEKINKLLINCKVIPFYKLVSLLPNENEDIDEELIIKILQKSAMLVQGNWIVKSEVLYSNSLNELAIIHDFISYLFTKYKQLRRQDITAQIRFPLESLMIVLNTLAKFDTRTRAWHFIYPTDEQFLRKHETVKQQMEVQWELKRLQIFKNLNLQIEKFREKTKRSKQPAIKKIDDKPIKPIKKRLRKKIKL